MSLSIIYLQPILSADPEFALGIFQQIEDHIVTQTVGIMGDVTKMTKGKIAAI